MLPEGLRRLVFPANHEVTLCYACAAECLDDPFGEGSANPLAAVEPRYSKVLQIAPPAVGSRQHRADNDIPSSSDKAEAGVSPEISEYCFARVHVPESESLGPLPKRHDLLIVLRLERNDFNHGRPRTPRHFWMNLARLKFE